MLSWSLSGKEAVEQGPSLKPSTLEKPNVQTAPVNQL